MAHLEDWTTGARVAGVAPADLVTVTDITEFGSDSAELTYEDDHGNLRRCDRPSNFDNLGHHQSKLP